MATVTPQTQSFAVAVGVPVKFVAGDNFSFIAQPGALGTIALDYSVDGVNFTNFATSALGVSISLNAKTLNIGQFGVIRATAFTAAGILLACDMSQPGHYVAGNAGILLNTGRLFTTPNLTTEGNVFGLRIPVGTLKPDFKLELDFFYSLAGAGGTKTFKVYMGNTGAGTSAYAPTAVASGTANGRVTALICGAGDGATINCYGNIYAAAAIAATQAAISSNAAYLTAEQELYVTVTKGTGTDTTTITHAGVKLIQ